MELTQKDNRWIALTASHLADGMIGHRLLGAGKDSNTSYGDLLELWGQGCLELHAELSQYAEPIYSVMCELSDEKTFPGAFHYEVTEEFGEWFAGMIVEHDGEAPSKQACLAHIAKLIIAFFDTADAEDKEHVVDALTKRGWITLPQAQATSPWAVETVVPKFKVGDEVYHLSGKDVRKAVVSAVTVDHRVWQAKEDAQPYHSSYVQYAVEGVGQVRQDTVFATADEAFAAAK